MNVEVIPAGIDQRPLVRNLYQFYAYDSSDWEGVDVEADGRFYIHDPYFNQYWENDGWGARLIMADGAIAGFLLVERSDVPGVDAAEFADVFIFKKFRRRGVGRQVAKAVIADSESPWIVNVFRQDVEANGFWDALFRSSLFRSVQGLEHPDGDELRSFLVNGPEHLGPTIARA